MSSRSPKPLVRCSASMTTSPRRSPDGMMISSLSAPPLGGLGLGEQLLVGGEAGLALGLAGLGRHAHPLELALEGALAGRTPASPPGARRSCFCSSQLDVVALERDAPAVVELEDPAGHVVEEVAVVGDGHDGAGVVAAGTARARPPTRRRGGWWARRAAAGRARPAAGGTARPGGARHRRAWSRRRRRAAGAGRPWRSRSCASRSQAPAASILRFEVGLLLAELLVVGVGVGPLGQDLVVALEQRRRLGRRRPSRCR